MGKKRQAGGMAGQERQEAGMARQVNTGREMVGGIGKQREGGRHVVVVVEGKVGMVAGKAGRQGQQERGWHRQQRPGRWEAVVACIVKVYNGR